MSAIYSIGHSNLQYRELLEKLRQHGVTALADVRTTPYSAYQPQFNWDVFGPWLKRDGIAYVHMGVELGGRPGDPDLYFNGIGSQLNYTAFEASEPFINGVSRLIAGSEKFKIAMMCSEGDPTTCHRCLLIGRHLAKKGFESLHIQKDDVFTQADIDQILIEKALKKPRGISAKLNAESPIDPNAPNLLELAYDRQVKIITHRRQQRHVQALTYDQQAKTTPQKRQQREERENPPYEDNPEP